MNTFQRQHEYYKMLISGDKKLWKCCTFFQNILIILADQIFSYVQDSVHWCTYQKKKKKT